MTLAYREEHNMSQSLTTSELESARQAVARAWAAGPAAGPAPEAAVAAEAINGKDLFCNNWDTVKQVLSFLQTIVPPPGNWIVSLIVSAGNAVQPTICKK